MEQGLAIGGAPCCGCFNAATAHISDRSGHIINSKQQLKACRSLLQDVFHNRSKIERK